MELCTIHAISKLPSHHSNKLLIQNPSNITNLHCSKSSLLTLRRALPLSAALRLRSQCIYSRNFVTKATASEETSSGTSEYGGEERKAVATLEDVPPVDSPVYGKTPEPELTKEESQVYGKALEPEVTTEGELPGDVQSSIFEFLDKLNIDTEDKFSLALYGSGAFFSLWLAAAVVGAIDAIPLFPKLMELVGLGYTVWFTYRYLIFKNTREELFAKFEELKDEVIG